jgi:hypothetical protein
VIDPNTAVWQSVVAHARTRRESLLADLAKMGLTHDQSQVIRGRIAELSDLIRLPETLAKKEIARQQMG